MGFIQTPLMAVIFTPKHTLLYFRRGIDGYKAVSEYADCIAYEMTSRVILKHEYVGDTYISFVMLL